MESRGATAGGPRDYEAPRLTMHGSVTDATQAAIVGPIIDNSQNNQGRLIVGNTSL